MPKRAAKKSRRKPAAKSRATKARAPKAPPIPGSPRNVSTGKGPGPREIGEDLVRRFNQGKWGLDDRLWSKSIVCIEGMGMAWHGRKNVDAKNAGWYITHKSHGASAEGPYVGSTGFAVKFRMDIEEKATGKRTLMEEVGVYTVMGGKIIREEFMYGPTEPIVTVPPAHGPTA